MCGDFSMRPLQKTTQRPYDFEDSNEGDEPEVVLAQYPIEDIVGSRCLLWVILKQVTQNDTCIEPDYQRNLFDAPASIAEAIF